MRDRGPGPKVAVIMFPGNNCEEESRRACISAGMDAKVLRWNTQEDLSRYEGFILPGGWSYEDRIRAGVVASKDRVMETIKKEAAKGKPVIGICNGAQILVESGLVPGTKAGLQMALAGNVNPFVKGFYCTWVRMKVSAQPSKCAFTRLMKEGQVMRVPVAHGEGRFTTKEDDLLERLSENGQVTFRYCGENGEVAEGFPENPNGSAEAIAGICNPEGNVLALMPHPERCAWKRQVPGLEGKGFLEMESAGPGAPVFSSMADYIRKEGWKWK
jgi:phosphoribosylformylglycinamidine synthase subunit PurQ / glutaminase